MKLYVTTFMVCCTLGLHSTRASDKGDAPRLPAPLDNVTCDFGRLEKTFNIVESRFYDADEFTVDGRVVAEETIVWTLEAKEAIKGKEVHQLLHPNPSPNPFFKVRFFRIADGEEKVADARPQGYSLIRDGRWIDPRKGPDLDRGDKLHVWVHLGTEGSAGLTEQKAAKMVVTTK